MNVLENALIKLRALEPGDADLLYIWENDTDIWQVGETLTPFSHYTLQQYVNNASQDIYEAKQLRLMIDAKDNCVPVTVGSIDLYDFNPYHSRAGIGLLIYSAEDRQKKYASNALELIINYCFTILHMNQLYCCISAENDKSVNLFRKFGFEIAGLKREWLYNGKTWVDEYTMQLLAK